MSFCSEKWKTYPNTVRVFFFRCQARTIDLISNLWSIGSAKWSLWRIRGFHYRFMLTVCSKIDSRGYEDESCEGAEQVFERISLSFSNKQTHTPVSKKKYFTCVLVDVAYLKETKQFPLIQMQVKILFKTECISFVI